MASKYKISVLLEAIDKMTKPMKGIARQVDKLRAPFKRMSDAWGRVGSKMGAITKRLGLGFAGLYATISAAVLKFISMGDTIGKTADKLGITTTELQKLRYAAEKSGVATQTFDMAYQRFARRIGEAQKGTGVALQALTDLGIGLYHGNGTLKTSIELFHEVADKITTVKDQTSRLALTNKFFDSEGVKLVNMLKDGSRGLKDYGDRLERIGGIIDDETIRASERLTDDLTDLKAIFGGLVATVIGKLIPQLSIKIHRFIESFEAGKTDIVKSLKSITENILAMGEGFISQAVKIIGKLFDLVGSLFGVEDATDDATDSTEKFTKAGKALANVLAILAIAKVVAGLVDMASSLKIATVATWKFTASLLANPLTWITVALTALGLCLYWLAKHWDFVKFAVEEVWKKISDFAKSAWDWGVNIIKNLWGGIKSIWGSFTSWLSEAWDSLIGWLPDFITGGGSSKLAVAGSAGGASTYPASGSNFTGNLQVEFLNAPKGTRIRNVSTSGTANMSVDTGLVINNGAIG